MKGYMLHGARRILTALASTFLGTLILTAAGLWMALFAAGFVGGFISRRLGYSMIVGVLGSIPALLVYFGSFYAVSPRTYGEAFGALSQLLSLTLILGSALTVLGALAGASVTHLPTRRKLGERSIAH